MLSNIVAYEWTAQYARQVVFLDTRENPHIHELMLKHGGSWQHTDLTRLTDAPELVWSVTRFYAPRVFLLMREPFG